MDLEVEISTPTSLHNEVGTNTPSIPKGTIKWHQIITKELSRFLVEDDIKVCIIMLKFIL